MVTTAAATGASGEDLACVYLEGRGYEILERNWRPGRWGEIDIIAIAGDILVFVEVRTRSGEARVSPQGSVGPHKLRVLQRTAQLYSKLHPEYPQALRIDLVAISLPETAALPQITLFKNITG